MVLDFLFYTLGFVISFCLIVYFYQDTILNRLKWMQKTVGTRKFLLIFLLVLFFTQGLGHMFFDELIKIHPYIGMFVASIYMCALSFLLLFKFAYQLLGNGVKKKDIKKMNPKL